MHGEAQNHPRLCLGWSFNSLLTLVGPIWIIPFINSMTYVDLLTLIASRLSPPLCIVYGKFQNQLRQCLGESVNFLLTLIGPISLILFTTLTSQNNAI